MSVAGTYDIVTKTPMGDQKGKFTGNFIGHLRGQFEDSTFYAVRAESHLVAEMQLNSSSLLILP